MARKGNKTTDNNEDLSVSEEINEKVSDVNEVMAEEIVNETDSAIEAAVKEYNGEIKEEKRLRIRERQDIAKNYKINKKVLIIAISVIFALIISFVALAIINKTNSNVYRNIYLGEKELTGMTTAELKDYLKTEQEKTSKRTLKILQGNEKILEVMPADVDLEIDMAAVEKNIFGYGRDSNIVKNNFDIVYALISRREFDVIYKYNVSKMSALVKEVKESLDDKVIDDSFVVDENQYKLIITKGKSGNTIDEQELKNQIISSLTNDKPEYKLKIKKGTPTELDVDVVYSEVKREAENAYIDKTTSVHKFVPHKVGLDFNKEELQKLLSAEENKQEGKIIEFKLSVVEPEVKTSDIAWEMYDYKISSYTTYFATTDPNRVTNLRLALEMLNGKVIMPGEVFSYNNTIGGATEAQGFKAASTFVGGRIVREVGGGICQTVSTLYNTALLANLEIVQRKAHSLPVAYVPGSRDATVYHPSIDFKFKNTREYPIKIVTDFNSSGNLTISLYGTKQENEYVVSITSKTISTIPYETEYINDNTMEKGTQKVVQNGTNGYKSESYITKKLNGQVVSSTLLSRDTYKAVNRIVRVGTKEVYVAPTPAPAPTPTPEPTPSVPKPDSGNDSNQDTTGGTTTPDTSGNQNTTNPNE